MLGYHVLDDWYRAEMTSASISQGGFVGASSSACYWGLGKKMCGGQVSLENSGLESGRYPSLLDSPVPLIWLCGSRDGQDLIECPTDGVRVPCFSNED